MTMSVCGVFGYKRRNRFSLAVTHLIIWSTTVVTSNLSQYLYAWPSPFRFYLKMKSVFLISVLALAATMIAAEDCGSFIQTASGGISYKPFEPVPSNVRCVWMIHPENTTGFIVDVGYLGFSSDDPTQKLIITGATPAHGLRHRTINTTGEETFERTTSLMITFFSGNNSNSSSSNTGFFLQYTSSIEYNLGVSMSPDSTFNLANQDTFIMTYDALVERELSLFVFPPAGNIFHPERTTRVVYIRNGAPDSFGCDQSLSKYIMDVEDPGVYRRAGSICGNTTSDLVAHNDVILYVLETRTHDLGPGFHFTYTACQ